MKTVCKFVTWLQNCFVIIIRCLIGLAPIFQFNNLDILQPENDFWAYVCSFIETYVEIWAASSEKVGFGGLPTKFDIKVI